ncbi:MAG: acylneuraminate cytidylyltransferase [Acidobacteria bacterium]|nr:MAG: acylneuraminate cytidylyltransferase [Acidobacteriota bacterium]
MMRTVAIIPARGGSKGIPRKNIIDFCGYPLVSWTIACARRCPRIDAVYVSTDDAEIAEVSRHYGAEIIERPANIAGDTSSSESAVIHACEVIRQKNLLPDAVIMMQATSPLRETSELDDAITRFAEGSLDSLFSAAQPEDMLLWIQDGADLHSLNFDYKARKRRQDATHGIKTWIETGSYYITKTELLLASGNRLGGRIGMWAVPFWKSFEIDSVDSLQVCAALMRAYKLDTVVPAVPQRRRRS